MKIVNKLLIKYLADKKLKKIKKIDELKEVPKNFLVISNTALGDTLLSLPAIKSLKLSFPQSGIVLLTHSSVVPLLNNINYIDIVVPFYGGYNKIFKTINIIKKSSPECSLIFHGNAPLDISIAALSGCRFILKHPTTSSLKKYLSYNFEKKNQHTIEDRLDLVRKINGKIVVPEMDIGVLEDSQKVDKVNHMLKKEKKYIAFQVGAADIYKMWSIERFLELAELIVKNYDFDIIITGVEKEFILGEKIAQKLQSRVLNLCGKTTIDELPYLLKRCEMLITNDTGTMHLAVALKVPTISLFSPTDSRGIGPYQDIGIHKVIQKDGSYIQKLPKKKRSSEAMKLIEIDEVYELFCKSIS